MSLRTSRAWDGQPSDIFSSPSPKFRGRRSRAEMMVDILRAVNAGEVGPTRIMYKSNLSWFVCQELLRHLCAKGFLMAKTDGGRRRYELTATGLDVMRRFVGVAKEMGS